MVAKLSMFTTFRSVRTAMLKTMNRSAARSVNGVP